MDPVPKKKPITREKFEEKVDLYMQGLFGGMGRELLLPLLNKVYQEAKDAGVVTPEEAYKYAQDKSNYYKDLNMRQQMRAPFKKGGNYNPSGKNQYTDKMRDFKSVQNAIDNAPPKIIKGKEYPLTKKDLRGEGEYYKNKIVTRNELKRFPNLKIPAKGKPITVKKSKYGKERQKFITANQGSEISASKGSGYNFSHFLPKVKGIKDVTSKDTGFLKASDNRSAEGYDREIRKITKEQKRLVDKKPKDYKKDLIKQNYLAANASKKFSKKLGGKVKGTLGYYTVDPNTLEFKAKGINLTKTTGGLSEKPTVFKTEMDKTGRKEFGKKQTIIQKLIDKNPDLKRATSIKGGGDRVRLKPVGISPFRKLRYMSKGGPVKYGKYAKQISKLSS